METEIPTVYPNKTQKIYVKVVRDGGDTWGFEKEALGDKLSLNTRPETTIVTDGAVKHNGAASALVTSDAALGKPNLYPQMIVKNGAAQTVFVTSGKNYEITFWVYQPSAGGNFPVNYWLAVSEDDAVFEAEDADPHSRLSGLVAEGTYTPTATDTWQKVTVTVSACAAGGKLRLGIIGDGNADHPFYIDDMTVTEMTSEQDVWSFDKETVGTRLSLNTSDPARTITVDDFIKLSGYHSARVNGNTKSGDYSPQMMVKNDDGEQVQVYEGRSYQIKFRIYKPGTQPKYGINYWFAATTEETDREFNNSDYRVNNHLVTNATDVKVETDQWVEILVSVTNCKYTGKLRFGIAGDYNGDFLFYVDDLVVSEVFLEPETRVDSFERYEDGKTISFNTDGAAITVTGADRRSGSFSAKIETLGNDINSAPQMPICDFRANPISVEKGKNYRLSFWVVRPITEAEYDIKFWLAATNNDKAFTTARDGIVLDTQTVEIDRRHVWQKRQAPHHRLPRQRQGATGHHRQHRRGAHVLYRRRVIL